MGAVAGRQDRRARVRRPAVAETDARRPRAAGRRPARRGAVPGSQTLVPCRGSRRQRSPAQAVAYDLRRPSHSEEETEMSNAPKWLTPVAIVGLLWNLLGCFAWVMDMRLTPEQVAAMGAEMQQLYASRPLWAVSATGVAVLGGAVGC